MNEPKAETPPGGYRAARGKWTWKGLGFDGVGALAVFALGGYDGQAHPFAQCSAYEAPERMRLPAGCFEQLFRGSPVWALQHFEDRRGLASFAAAGGLLGAFWRLLGGAGGSPRFAFLRRSVGALCAAAGAFFGLQLGRFGSFFSDCDHVFSFGGGFRDHMNHSGRSIKQVNCDGNRPWRN